MQAEATWFFDSAGVVMIVYAFLAREFCGGKLFAAGFNAGLDAGGIYMAYYSITLPPESGTGVPPRRGGRAIYREREVHVSASTYLPRYFGHNRAGLHYWWVTFFV